MVIFHSYVSLPEGTYDIIMTSNQHDVSQLYDIIWHMYPHVSQWNKSTYSGCNTVNLELGNISLRWPCMPKMACETSLAGNLGDPTAGCSFSLTWWWCMFFWCLNYSDNIGLNFPLILDFQWLKLHDWFFMIFTYYFTWSCDTSILGRSSPHPPVRHWFWPHRKGGEIPRVPWQIDRKLRMALLRMIVYIYM